MNIPTNVIIAVELNKLLNKNLDRFSYQEILDTKNLIKDEEFELAEKKLAKVNLLTPSGIHRLIRKFMAEIIYS